MYRTRFNPSPVYGNKNQGHLRKLISAILLIAVFTGCTATPQESSPAKEISPTIIPSTEIPIIEGDLQTALVNAVRADDVAGVQRTLEAGADPNLDSNLIYPMLAAVYGGNVEVVRLLVEYGGDVTMKAMTGDTLIDLAMKEKHPQLAEYLIEQFDQLEDPGELQQSADRARWWLRLGDVPDPFDLETYEIRGEFVTGEITSPALANNLFDDPETRSYLVYLPPSYANGSQHYPVIYALHGGHTHDETELQPIAVLLDWMIANTGTPEMIIVFSNSQSVFGATYGNSPNVGDRETYITQDLVNYIDANFRTISNRDSRAITGCAPGGAAAIKYAFAHPDTYNVVAGLSGMYDPASDVLWTSALRKFPGAPGDFTEYQDLAFDVRMRFALTAEAATNLDKPPFFLDMPFEVVDGKKQIVPEVAEKINATYPVNVLPGILDNYFNQPEQLSGIMLYHIDGSQELPVGHAVTLSELLTQAGIDHEVYIDRRDIASCWNVAPVLQFFGDHLSFEMP